MEMDFAVFQQVLNTQNDERNTSARFYDKAIKTGEVTANGLPVFKNVTYIEIRLKDNNTEVFNQPATIEKIKRFPAEYAFYLQSKKKVSSGTPLEQFAFLTAAEIATCKNRGIFTVEDLAELNIEKVNSLCLQKEHILAQTFIENAKHNGNLSSFVQKEEEYKKEISRLTEKIEILQKQIHHQKHYNSKKGKVYENNSRNM